MRYVKRELCLVKISTKGIAEDGLGAV